MGQLDTKGKKALYKEVGINRISIRRWITGENTPDARHLVSLTKAVPLVYQERFRSLMMEDPKVRKLLPSELSNEPFSQEKISQRVYERALRVARDTPERFWILCETILFEALNQLESRPVQTGLEILVARCMPPREDGIVRSLRAHVAMGTGPWRADLHLNERFLGIESLAGYAVMQRHGVMVPNLLNTTIIVPAHLGDERSSAAYPIMREGHVAGVLIVSSSQIDYFSPEICALIEKYADLVRLAFYDEEFYSSSSIELALMPSWEMQETYFASFRSRVNEAYRRISADGPSMSGLTQVEPRVRQMIEGELLEKASLSEETVKGPFVNSDFA
jgi:hypothetical protein